jgi:hypothetical protein
MFEVIPPELQEPGVEDDEDDEDEVDDVMADLNDQLPEDNEEEMKPEVPKDADNLIRRKLPHTIANTKTVTVVGGYQLRAADLRRLVPLSGDTTNDMWLDDSVLDAYGTLISASHPDVHILPEVVTRRLESPFPADQRHGQAFIDAGRPWLFGHRLVLAPVCVSHH